MSDQPTPIPKGHCLDPLSLSSKPFPISSVLRRYISQEGRDGPEYDVIAQAAEYIDELEKQLAEAREQRDRLAEALKMFKAEGPDSNACFCDAQFAMHGAHPRHTDECIAATEALAAVEGGKQNAHVMAAPPSTPQDDAQR